MSETKFVITNTSSGTCPFCNFQIAYYLKNYPPQTNEDISVSGGACPHFKDYVLGGFGNVIMFFEEWCPFIQVSSSERKSLSATGSGWEEAFDKIKRLLNPPSIVIEEIPEE